MAYIALNTGINQEKGVSYTSTTATSADWGDVPADSYFYDFGTDLPYYKNASNTVISVFSSGGGGNTIYSANDTVGTGRIATLTDSLRFKNGTFQIQGNTTLPSGKTLELYDNATTPNKTLEVLDNGKFTINFQGTGSPNPGFVVNDTSGLVFSVERLNNIAWIRSGATTLRLVQDLLQFYTVAGEKIWEFKKDADVLGFGVAGTEVEVFNDCLRINGNVSLNALHLRGDINFNSIATTSSGAGDVWSQNGVLRIGTSEKIELSSINNGILLNRVTTSEMNSITGMADNEIVFNKELHALYRYDLPTTSWIALAAGFGIVEVIRDSDNGTPKFYADLETAIEDCKASGSYNIINIHSNLTINSQINIKNTGSPGTTGDGFLYKSLIINTNGYNLVYDNSADTRMFSVLLNQQDFKIIGKGYLERLNSTGTSSSCLVAQGSGLIELDAKFSNNEGNAISLQVAQTGAYTGLFCNLHFSNFIGNPQTGTSAALGLRNGNYQNFNAISESAFNSLFLEDNIIVKNFTYENTSTGAGLKTFGNNQQIYNFTGTTNAGLNLQNASLENSFDNFILNGSGGTNTMMSATKGSFSNGTINASGTNYTSLIINPTKLDNLTFINSGTGFVYFANNASIDNQIIKNCFFTSFGDYSTKIEVNASGEKSVFNDCIFENKKTSGASGSVLIDKALGGGVDLLNCTFSVVDSSANNLYATQAQTIILENNIFKGATTPVNSYITNAQAYSNDIYGNTSTSSEFVAINYIEKSVGSTYTTNNLLTVTQAEYDALTPDANTIYFIV